MGVSLFKTKWFLGILHGLVLCSGILDGPNRHPRILIPPDPPSGIRRFWISANAVSEFSDDMVESNGVGYRLKTGLGLRRDIAPLVRNRRLESSAIASPEQRQPLLRDLAATANYLRFRRWNQTPTA
ncbi:MAG: hypothetical protein ACXU9C_07550, partial [Xanthobacteraceae bacterium]